MKIIILVLIAALATPAFAQFPAPYCNESFPTGILPITRVTIGTINNLSPVTPAGPAHENFTTLSTGLMGGQLYTITVGGTTNGAFQDRYYVYADWNRDGDFFDAGEQKFIGNITNSTGADAISVSNTLAPPVSATPGISRLRVAKRSNVNSTACSVLTGFGQAEDYTIVISVPPPMAFYVKPTAPGSDNTGSSWVNAFTDLALALSTARAGDTIKVATGTFKPGNPSTNTFYLKEGVTMMGGYPATGNPVDADRNFNLHPVTLSGVMGGSYNLHVLSGYDLTAATIIDGFVIADGRAQNGPSGSIDRGGGLILDNAHPVFRNCVFRNNEARKGGAAAFFNSNPSFTNCIFRNNESPVGGGGAAAYAEGSSPVFMKCVFVNNGLSDPNTPSVVNNTLNSNATIINSIFSRNTGRLIHNDQSTLTLQYSSLVHNTLNYPFEFGRPTIWAVNNSTVSIANSILYFNNLIVANDTSDIYLSNSVANVTNSITQAYFNGNPTVNFTDPRFIDTSDIDGPDNLYFTADDGLRLKNPCSPAINTGTLAVTGVPTDILGNPRVFGALSDMGAYELQAAVLPVSQTVYVNKLATGSNDGSNWANAFTEMRTAMLWCSDTIKVAAGIYYPSDTDPIKVFWMENNKVLLGGYPATGNPGDAQRDPVANPTILSGNMPATAGGKSFTILRGRYINNTSVVDGFIIQDADDTYVFNNTVYNGAAIYLTSGASPVFRKCVIKNNSGDQSAVRTYNGSNVSFIDCVFDNNTPAPTAGNGGAISNFNSSPYFLKCLFKENETNFRGGAMYNSNSHPVIDSCTFFKNESSDYGAAIANVVNSNPIITNSLFQANFSEMGANDIYNDNSSPVVSNTMFSDSVETGNGGSVANKNQSNPVFTKCQFYDGKASNNGAVLYNENSTATFNHCVFYRSTGGMISTRYGTINLNNCLGVLNSSLIHSRKSEINIVHCTFALNRTNLITNTDSTNLLIQNSIFSNNLVTNVGYPPEFTIGTPSYNPSFTTVLNSLMEGGTSGSGGNIEGISARFLNHEDPMGPDGVFMTADDGIQLSRCSPAINSGSNALSNGITTDLLGNVRNFNGSVDMGAYEYMANPSTSGNIYVNSAATGSNNGTSWQNAFTDLTHALRASCTDTIKIAAGTYKPVAARDSSFRFNKAKVIWGGYPPTGNPTNADRDPVEWPVILSGDIGVAGDSADNIFHVVIINQPDTVVEIDGLTIERGNANGSNLFPGFQYYHVRIPKTEGGGIFHRNGKVRLTNSIVKNNTSQSDGGGYFNDYGSIEFDRNIFTENHTTNWFGGAYFSRLSMIRKTRISNSIFMNNKAAQQGGALHFEPGSIDTVVLRNNVFLNNKAYQGGAIYMYSNFYTSIINNTFAGNSTITNGPGSLRQGGAIYARNAFNSPVYNNIFYKNEHLTTTTVGADIYNNTCPTFVPGCTNFNLRRNILQIFGAHSIGANLYTSPLLLNEADPDGPDNKWFTNDDGYQLLFNSPGIDYGDNPAIAGVPLDILGNPRINNSIVDLGAFEFANLPFANAGRDTLICEGNSVQLGTTGNPAHTYSWTSSPAGFTSGVAMPVVTPSITTSYYLEVSNGTVTARDTVLVTITQIVTPSVSVTASATTICSGASVTFTAVPINGGTAPSYQWQVNGVNAGTNNPVFTSISIADNDQVTVIMTSNFSCISTPADTSTAVSMTVGAVVPSASISASSSSICAGTNVTFIATPINGGTAPSWQWQVNGVVAGTNDPVFSSASLNNGSEVKVIMTSSATCASPLTDTSNIITVTVTPTVVPQVTISATATTACAGTSLTFTAAPVNGGSSPVYQWQVNGGNTGANSPVFTTSTLSNNDVVKVIMTSTADCATPSDATSNLITVTINPVLAPAVTIAASAITICPGENVTFTATPANGGSNPSYQWNINGVNAGSDNPVFNSATLANNSQVTVTLTSNALCAVPSTATSNIITITHSSSVVPSVTVAASSTVICAGTNVTFTASPVNGGSAPSYQWQVGGINAGSNSPVFASSSLANGNQVTVIMTSSSSCASPATAISSPVTITVNAVVVPAVSVTAFPTNTCPGDNIVFTANASGQGTGPLYQWQVNGVNTGTNSTTYNSSVLNNNDIVTVNLTSNASCASPVTVSSSPVTVSIGSVVTPSITISGQTIVLPGTSSSISSAVTGGGSNPLYQWQDSTSTHGWQDIAGAVSPGISYAPVSTGDKLRCIVTGNASCATSSNATSNVLTFALEVVIGRAIVYPVPSRDFITIDSLNVNDKWDELQILNMNGARDIIRQNIQGRNKVTINISPLAAGVYYIMLSRKEGNPAYLRFIKL